MNSEQQKEINRVKSKKYYDDVTSKKKIVIYCSFCKEEHEPLEISYKRNIAKNGRYICEREGGHIIGKRPKKKKENPFAAEGKKECTKCKQVKVFEEFGSNKTRSDGYSNRCLECRREVANEQYKNNKK